MTEIPGNRETAYRVFAAEFDDATVSHQESDEERAPNYVVTPTGAHANRVFAVGVLTEVESVNDDVLRARIVDPTGAFVVYAGQYQPDEMAALERLDPPEFVAVTGKARTFSPDDSEQIYTSIRPESINTVDAETRDRWVVATAEHTVERVGTVAAAAAHDATGDALQEALAGADLPEATASGCAIALAEYGTTPAYLAGVRDLAMDAARVVAGERDEVTALDRPPGDAGDESVTYDALATPLDVPQTTATASEPETLDASDAETVDASDAETVDASDAEIAADDDAEIATDDDAEIAADEEATAAGGDAESEAQAATAEVTAATTDSAVESTTDAADATDGVEGTATPEEISDASSDVEESDANAETDGEPEGDTGADSDAVPEGDTGADSDAVPEGDTGADSDAVPEGDAGTESDGELGDFEPGSVGSETQANTDEMYEFDEEEREEIEAEYGTEFSSGNDVPEPEESDLDAPDPAPADGEAAGGTDASAGADEGGSSTDESPASTDESPASTDEGTAGVGEPDGATEAVDSPGDQTDSSVDDTAAGASEPGSSVDDTAAGAGEPGSSVDDTDTGAGEPGSSADGEPTSDGDVDLDAVVMDRMHELDEDGGADRDALIETVVDETGVTADAVEDAVQDALMGGQCYEPEDGVLKPI
jgi:RPA family protein